MPNDNHKKAEGNDGAAATPSGLPSSLCALCSHSLMIVEAILVDEFPPEPGVTPKFFEREVAWCANEDFVGKKGDPIEMPYPVVRCEGFDGRKVEVTKGACPEKRALRARGFPPRDPQGGRRGRRRR